MVFLWWVGVCAGAALLLWFTWLCAIFGWRKSVGLIAGYVAILLAVLFGPKEIEPSLTIGILLVVIWTVLWKFESLRLDMGERLHR